MGAAVDAATRRLEGADVPMPRREAQRLMAWLLGTDRGGLVARNPDSVAAKCAINLERFLSRRENREPFQYLTGEQEFCGRTFLVDRRVLVPRPETEDLVGLVLGLPLEAGARVVDVGTGSGCIAVTLAAEHPEWKVIALDLSSDALALARENAARHGVESRIDFLRRDLAELPGEWSSSMEAVVSNPPYVSEEEWKDLAPEVREHEPKAALVPGPTGLEAYRTLAPEGFRVLRDGGFLVLELGYRSEAGAREAVLAAGLGRVEVRPDHRGISRILIARREDTRRVR